MDDSSRRLTFTAAAVTSAAIAGDGPVRELLMRATIASIVAPSSNETSPSRKFCRPWSLLYTPGLWERMGNREKDDIRVEEIRRRRISSYKNVNDVLEHNAALKAPN